MLAENGKKWEMCALNGMQQWMGIGGGWNGMADENKDINPQLSRKNI